MASEPGSYSLGCEVVYTDYRVLKKPCEPLTMVVDPLQPDLLPAFIAMGLVIAGIIIYAFIYYYKKPEQPLSPPPRKRFAHAP